MIYRVSITGTESTGKTNLAEKLAAHYKTVYVPDYSRGYIEKLDRKYNHTDVLHIAKGIIEQEDKMFHYAHRILFSDNDLIDIKIWLEHHKWSVPDWLEHEILKRKSDLYLLCDIDMPWVADNLRKNPDNRAELLNRFVELFTAIHANFKRVKGLGEERWLNAAEYVDELIANKQ